MMNKIYFSLILLFSTIFIGVKVHASTFTPTDDLFTGGQSNNLLLMAQNQIKNFTDYSFVIFRVDNNYYLVASKEFNINSNTIILNNSIIISAVRTDYYNTYTYSTYSDPSGSTQVNLNHIVISNIIANNTIASDTFDTFKFNSDIKRIGIFVLGLCFAMFLVRDRRYL